ncbi:hypothetical protein F4604DRAFT_1672913 [Suillus subluteus]|nr:hypothetical protein F4604DRAFT_1672913 [Suillus subluteus]
MADDKPLPSRPLDPNNRTIVIQNNHIVEGVTININPSNSYGSKHVAAQPEEPTSSQYPLARSLAPVDHGRESVVINGNTFGEHVVINIASPNSTGADCSSIPRPNQEPHQEPSQEYLVTGGFLRLQRSETVQQSLLSMVEVNI